MTLCRLGWPNPGSGRRFGRLPAGFNARISFHLGFGARRRRNPLKMLALFQFLASKIVRTLAIMSSMLSSPAVRLAACAALGGLDGSAFAGFWSCPLNCEAASGVGALLAGFGAGCGARCAGGGVFIASSAASGLKPFAASITDALLSASSAMAIRRSAPSISRRPSAFGLLVRALKQRVEPVAETWLPPARPNQGRHAVVYGVGHGAADHGDIGPRDLKKLCRIRIVQQSQKQMLKGDVTMGPLLGCSSGAP